MNREVPGLPAGLVVPCVDVRDVAEAHVRALVSERSLNGERIPVSKASYLMAEEIAEILRGEFEEYGYRVQTRRVGYWILKLASYFDNQVKIVLPMIGINLTFSNKLSKELLGMTYDKYSFKDTLIETGYSLIKQGLIRNLLPNTTSKTD